MALYPKFTVEKLTERCKFDISKFFTDNSDIIKDTSIYNNYSNIELLLKEGENNIDEINKKIKIIKDKFYNLTSIAENYAENNPIIKFSEFNYSHDINKFKEEVKNKLWLLRTILLYQLSIVCVFMVKDQEHKLFDTIYINKNPIIGTTRTFIPDVALENYEMAIFGSMKSSSDIDIGVVYNGNSGSLELGRLSYIISILEDLFLIFMDKKNSLDFDIEFYATMLSAKNPIPIVSNNTNTEPINSPDIYILDTSSFTQAEFDKLIPYASASILRNIYNHVQLSEETFNTVEMDDIINKINNFKYTHYKNILNATQPQITTKNDKINDKDKTYLSLENTNSDNIDTDILQNFNFTDTEFKEKFTKGLEMYKEYKIKDYNTARNQYYKLIDDAEIKFNEVTKIFDASDKKTENWQIELKKVLTSEENKPLIFEAVKAIAHMNLFREESYLLVPTVMHVVRVLQLESINKESGISTKYPVTYPECLTGKKQHELEGAVCEIGQYGYLLSILEQIGFILRFEEEYCKEDKEDNEKKIKNPKKCSDKILKYIKRYVDAINKIKEETETATATPTTGGKRRTHKKYKKRTTHKKKKRNPRKSKICIKKQYKTHKK